MLATLIEQLRLVLEHILLSMGYVGLAATMFIETIFPPIPSEVIVPFAGFLIATGEFHLTPALIATTTGALLGAIFFYYLGARLGEHRTRAFFKKYGKWMFISVSDFDRALSFFNRHSTAVVFWARFVPGVRSVISIPAGIARMNFAVFLVLTACGSAIWNMLLLTAGIYLGHNWDEALVIIDRFELVFYAAFLAFALYWIVNKLRAPRVADK
jgi:membrane protein DedA with SNARE-associated domain